MRPHTGARTRARRWGTAATALALSCGATALAAAPAGADPLDSHCQVTNAYGSPQAACLWGLDNQIDHFSVPGTVSALTVDAYGGNGGDDGPYAGGRGAEVYGSLSTSGLSQLLIAVGGNGQSVTTDGLSCFGTTPCPGGFNGGGNGGAGSDGEPPTGAGGGGLTGIVDPNTHARLIIAAGGGGASSSGSAGSSGGSAGASPGNGGSIASNSGGSAAGSSNSLGTDGAPAQSPLGGGGGGGAGMPGGLGGAAGDGGGAGASYGPGDEISTSTRQNPSLALIYNLAGAGVAMQCSDLAAGQSSTCTITVTPTDGSMTTAPTGTVQYTDVDGVNAPTCALSPDGDSGPATASCTVTLTPGGSTASGQLSYGGDNGYGTASSAFSQDVGGGGALSLIRNLARPAIHGGSAVGDRLSCSAGRWQGKKLKFTYAWKRDGKKLRGQTASRLKVVGADRGHSLVCTVTAHSGKAAVSASSRARHIPAARGHRRVV